MNLNKVIKSYGDIFAMIYSLSLYIGNDFLKYVKKIDELTKCMGKRAVQSYDMQGYLYKT